MPRVRKYETYKKFCKINAETLIDFADLLERIIHREASQYCDFRVNRRFVLKTDTHPDARFGNFEQFFDFVMNSKYNKIEKISLEYSYYNGFTYLGTIDVDINKDDITYYIHSKDWRIYDRQKDAIGDFLETTKTNVFRNSVVAAVVPVVALVAFASYLFSGGNKQLAGILMIFLPSLTMIVSVIFKDILRCFWPNFSRKFRELHCKAIHTNKKVGRLA